MKIMKEMLRTLFEENLSRNCRKTSRAQVEERSEKRKAMDARMPKLLRVARSVCFHDPN